MQLIAALFGSITYVIAQAENSGVLTYLQEKFEAGGAFMWPILLSLVLGLAFVIERFWSLSKASTNTKKFVLQIKEALDEGGIEKAIEICENSSSAIASVFHAGLMRFDEGLDAVEKAVMAYGALEMGFLEKGLIWISTFITIAPMIGFTGTVQGMIQAFDSIAAAAQISPGVVASGISVALLTTLFGLVTAMILQVFYNYFIAKIDNIVSGMEESSVELIDMLYALEKKKK